MLTNQTKLEAYLSIEYSLPKRQLDVINALKELNRATMHQVADHMVVPLNTISGRFSELKRKGLIKEVEIIKVSGSSRTVFEVVENGR